MCVRVDANQHPTGLRHPASAAPQVELGRLPVGLDKAAAVGQRLHHARGVEAAGVTLAE